MSDPKIYYNHQNGEFWLGDSLKWLQGVERESIDLIFADPPYNIGKDFWDNFESHEKYIEWCTKWVEYSWRALKPNGTLYVCGFTEIIADLKSPAMKFFKGCRWLIWHYKNKANLGNDWGRSHESIIHFRKSNNPTFNIDDVRIPYAEHTLKYPSHPQAESSQYGGNKNQIWTPNPHGAKPKDVIVIPTISNGMSEKTPHKTQKPEELIRKIILASSNEGDIVLDPFSGSGTTAVCAEQLRRKWMACDINSQYLDWGIKRVEAVETRDPSKWKEYDKKNNKRRN